jgi:dTDP-4-amino-4,6-dideoxygalactose transaminase
VRELEEKIANLIAEQIQLMQSFGFAGLDAVIYIGTNGNRKEISAAMGLMLLESLDDLIEENYKNYR